MWVLRLWWHPWKVFGDDGSAYLLGQTGPGAPALCGAMAFSGTMDTEKAQQAERRNAASEGGEIASDPDKHFER